MYSSLCIRMGGGGAEGAQAPPSFLDLYSKNFKISQIRDENFFFYLVVPPHKKIASVHPVRNNMIVVIFVIISIFIQFQ